MHDMATECESHETLGLSNPPVGTTIEELILQSGAAETGQISMAFGRLEAWLDHFWVAWEKRVIENTKPQNFAKISKNYFTLKKAAELSKMNPLKKKKKTFQRENVFAFLNQKMPFKKIHSRATRFPMIFQTPTIGPLDDLMPRREIPVMTGPSARRQRWVHWLRGVFVMLSFSEAQKPATRSPSTKERMIFQLIT